MLEQLFGSKTRFQLLKILFRDPEENYFVRELARALEVQINAIRRELDRLVKLGVVQELKGVKSEDGGHGSNLRKYYSLNKESLLFPELHALILKAQVLGEQEFISEIKAKAGKIKLFLLTGRFTGDKDVYSDLLLVGEIKEKSVSRVVKKYEKEFGFEIRYTIMTEQEFKDRRHVMDKFVFSLFEADNVKVIDKLGI